MLKEEQVLAYEFVGKRYDCGTKLGYLQATVDLALQHAEVRDAFNAWLHERMSGGPTEETSFGSSPFSP